MAKAGAGLYRRRENLGPQLEDLRERPDTRMLGSRVEDARVRLSGKGTWVDIRRLGIPACP